MPCVGSSLSISFLFAEPRFPEAGLSGSVCIDPPACMLGTSSRHWIWWCFRFTGRTWLTLCSRCRSRAAAGIWWQSWYDKRYEVVHCTSNCIPIFGQTRCFLRFTTHMNIRVQSKVSQAIELLAFSSICTVTNRSRFSTCTCGSSFVCTFPFAVTTVVVFLVLLKVSSSSELKSFLLSVCIEAPESSTNIRSAVFFETSTHAFIFHKRIKRGFSLDFQLVHIFRWIPRSFAGAIFLSGGFLKCPFLKLGRARISLMNVTFLDNISRWPFLFSEFELRIRCVLRILRCVPPKRSLSLAQLSEEQTSLDLNVEIHNLGLFYVSESQLLLEYPLSSTFCWAFPHHQHVETGNDCHKCIGFQTCNYDTREGAENQTTIFYTLLSMHKEFWLQSQGWPPDLLSSSRQSVPSPVVQKRMSAPFLFSLAR